MTDRSPVALGQVLKWGGLGGLTAVFISAIGMVEVFDSRKVIDPVLSLAYLLLMVIPLWIGYRVSKRTVLEGVEPIPPSMLDVVAGVATGGIAGVGLGAFILLIDTVNLRGVLVNVTPALLDLLTFGQGSATGVPIVLGLGVALGAVGGAMRLVPGRTRHCFARRHVGARHRVHRAAPGERAARGRSRRCRRFHFQLRPQDALVCGDHDRCSRDRAQRGLPGRSQTLRAPSPHCPRPAGAVSGSLLP